MKPLLVVAGVLAVAIGLAMMFTPGAFLAPQGLTLDIHTVVIARAQGSLLVGIGAIDLFASRISDRAALRPVLAGNVVTHLAALAVNIHALATHAVGSGVIGDVVGHVVLGTAFAIFWRRK